MIDSLNHVAQWAEQLWSPWELLAKSTLILAAGCLVAGVLKRRRMLAASTVWNATLLGLLVLPAAIACGPRLGVWPATAETATKLAAVELPDQSNAPWESEDRPAQPSTADPRPHPFASKSEQLPAAASSLLGNAPTSSRRPAWRGFIVLAMALGMLVSLMRLLFALIAVGQLRRTSRPIACDLWNDRLAYWSQRLGIRQVVSARQTPHIQIPIVTGAFRPTILLPASLAKLPDRQHVDAILAHELAHVKRRDYAWQLALRVVQAMYWYHPLAWLVERPISAVRERACDEFCVHALGSSQRYAATLLVIAGHLVRRPAMSLGLAMASTPRIAARLDAIEHSHGNPVCQLSRFANLVYLGFGLLLASGLASAAAQDGQAKNEQAAAAANIGDGLGVDLYGDRLPADAMVRLGTVRFRQSDQNRRSISYSADGRQLATTDGESVLLWNALTGERNRRLLFPNPGQGGLSANIADVTFSPVGNQLAARNANGIINIWDLSTGQSVSFAIDELVAPNDRPNGEHGGLAFSPDGLLLAVNWNRKTTVFDATTGRAVLKLQHEGANAQFGMAWSPDGATIAQGSVDPPARLWDARTGEMLREFKAGMSAFALSLAISPDGKTLAGGVVAGSRAPIMVCLWDLASGELKAKIPSEDVVGLGFTPDGKTLVGATEEGKINAWNVETRELRYSVEGKISILRSAALSPDGTTFAPASVSSEIGLWDVATGSKKLDNLVGHHSTVCAVAYSPDGRVIATGAEEWGVRIWDAATGKQLRKLDSQSSYSRLSFDRTGQRLATAGLTSGEVTIWDVNSGEKLHVLDKQEKRIRQLAYSHDGKQLITVGSNGNGIWSSRPQIETLRVWDANTGEHLRGSDFTAASTESLTLLVDGRSAVIGAAFSETASSIQVWNFQTGERTTSLIGHKESVNSLACGKGLVASGSRDKSIRLWDTQSWENVAVLIGHEAAIKCVAFSPDGQWLASADEGGSIRLWNVEKGTQIHEFRGSDYGCGALCFSPDGTRLVAGMADSTALVWDLRSVIAP